MHKTQVATGLTAGERMARRRSSSGCKVTCGLAFSRLSQSVGPAHWNNWDRVDGPSMSDPDWNTSHLQTKMFYSSMEMPTSIVGCSSFGPRDAWAWGGAGGVGDVRIW